jgi:acyl dehydratase
MAIDARGGTEPGPVEKAYLEDYRVGEVFTSPRRSMTETDVVWYSMFSGDWDRREDSDGTWIVPEMYVFSIGLCLLLSAGRYAWMPKSFIAFYGFDEIELAGGVRVGDTISSTVTVTDLVEKDGGRGLVVYRHETVDQNGRVVCASDHRALLLRRPADEEAQA